MQIAVSLKVELGEESSALALVSKLRDTHAKGIARDGSTVSLPLAGTAAAEQTRANHVAMLVELALRMPGKLFLCVADENGYVGEPYLLSDIAALLEKAGSGAVLEPALLFKIAGSTPIFQRFLLFLAFCHPIRAATKGEVDNLHGVKLCAEFPEPGTAERVIRESDLILVPFDLGMRDSRLHFSLFGRPVPPASHHHVAHFLQVVIAENATTTIHATYGCAHLGELVLSGEMLNLLLRCWSDVATVRGVLGERWGQDEVFAALLYIHVARSTALVSMDGAPTAAH
jgi:hypothetical protein